jgi:hypothetical protein
MSECGATDTGPDWRSVVVCSFVLRIVVALQDLVRAVLATVKVRKSETDDPVSLGEMLMNW